MLCTTSGTTGKPKLAMLTHAQPAVDGVRASCPRTRSSRDDEFLSFLPLAWIGEQMIAIACALPGRRSRSTSPSRPRPCRPTCARSGRA